MASVLTLMLWNKEKTLKAVLMILLCLFLVGCGSSSSAIIPSAGLTDEQKAELKREDKKVDAEEGQKRTASR
jgi:uncharacterized protein YceK